MTKVLNATADTSPEAMLELRKSFEKETHPLQIQADGFELATEDDYVMAGAFVVKAKLMIKDINDRTQPVVSTTFAAHKAATTLRKDALEVPTKALHTADRKMIAWRAQQTRLANEEAAREREAQRKANEESQLAKAEKLDAAGYTEAAEEVLSAPPLPTAHVPLGFLRFLRFPIVRTSCVNLRRWRRRIQHQQPRPCPVCSGLVR